MARQKSSSSFLVDYYIFWINDRDYSWPVLGYNLEIGIKKNLLRKNCLNFIFVILLYGSNLPLFSSSNSKDLNNRFALTTEFLENLPTNDYILGSGDVLNVIVTRDLPELTTRNIVIDGEGTIIIPRLNRIFVEGLTINELIKLLNEAFQKYVKYPNVEVIVSKYRPINVFVEGEVVTPGLQTLRGAFNLEDSIGANFNFDNEQINKKPPNTYSIKRPGQLSFFPTVFDAIRQSGGITEYSDLSNIKVIRKNKISEGGGKITTTLNFKDLLYSGKNTQNIRIYDGDIIKIRKLKGENINMIGNAILSNLNPRYIEVFVAGRVNFPGYVRLSRAGVLTDAIDMAGGAKILKGPLTFIRFNSDGSVDKRKFNYRKNAKRGSFKNPVLNSGDLIIIGGGLLTAMTQVTKEFTSPFVGIYSTYSIFEAILD